MGFLPLNDAAPLVAAEVKGHFSHQGLRVELSREVGWATIREKIIHGELDAAQAPAPMLWSVALGLESARCAVMTALILNLNGNAITLAKALKDEGVNTAADLRTVARQRTGERRLTFGVVFRYSSHHTLLRRWLASGGIDPDRDVRTVVVPPAQMFRNLVAGTIDGYCAGEPWNTLAVQSGEGWCPTWSAKLQSGHIEKVLMVSERFVRENPGEHAALIRSLTASAAWCDRPENRPELAELLSRSRYINQPKRIIAPSLLGRFDDGFGTPADVPDFHVFHADEAGRPTEIKGRTLQGDLVSSGLIPPALATTDLPRRLFRGDLHLHALRTSRTHELVS